ncbi:leucine-rich repeat-containing protein 42 isoform X1 [Anolis carolinensis]|uniref:leucine-rich repeat-containing protein 42 isoform X1 n=2 Tax=Anolis carolinensis TaxID=28377 RepID=UPI002F2B1726
MAGWLVVVPLSSSSRLNLAPLGGMSYYLHEENLPDRGPIYVRENGQLYKVNKNTGRVNNRAVNPGPSRLFSKGFSVELYVNRGNDNGRTDHFIFTYTKEGNLRYSAKSLFNLVLSYIADNMNHVDSLIGFPEQIAEKLFYAADARQKFSDSRTGLCALQKFTEVYGSLVLQTLCLKKSYLVISEKLEEIKSFQGLVCLDLSCCKLGDDHDLLQHITNATLSSLVRLLLKDNCLSDAGLRKMTAPVRIMKRGLENLTVLDLSYNPEITHMGIGYLLSFKKLNYLDLSGTGLKCSKTTIYQIQTKIGLVHSEESLKEFDHNNCKTEGWAEQTVLQWQHAILESIKAKEKMKSRTSTQRFYGKRRKKEEPLQEFLEEKQSKTSENLQFYRKSTDMANLSALQGKTEMNEELQNKKRVTLEQKEQTFQSKHFTFSVEDLDLLNSY